MKKSACGPAESRETPKMEARNHSAKFLKRAVADKKAMPRGKGKA